MSLKSKRAALEVGLRPGMKPAAELPERRNTPSNEVEINVVSSESLYPEPLENTREKFTGNDSHRFEFGSPGPVLGVTHGSLAKAVTHVSSQFRVEAGGLCLGRVFKDRRSRHLLIILDTTVPAEATMDNAVIQRTSSLTFAPEAWRTMIEVSQLKFPELRILGWYHSHPGFGIFLSSMDLFIHNEFFTAPWQVALVIDPLQKQAGFFVRSHGRLRLRGLQWSGNLIQARPLSPLRRYLGTLRSRAAERRS